MDGLSAQLEIRRAIAVSLSIFVRQWMLQSLLLPNLHLRNSVLSNALSVPERYQIVSFRQVMLTTVEAWHNDVPGIIAFLHPSAESLLWASFGYSFERLGSTLRSPS